MTAYLITISMSVDVEDEYEAFAYQQGVEKSCRAALADSVRRFGIPDDALDGTAQYFQTTIARARQSSELIAEHDAST